MTWVHDISQAALAAAVMTLGLVMLLELRSVARLRRTVDCNLARVFEQLDLLRFENQQLLEAQTQPQSSRARRAQGLVAPAPGAGPTTSGASAGAAPADVPATPAGGVPAGEARLLASLAAARARRAEAARDERVTAASRSA